jgi:4-amino-4-deoxy-L-arabinose transferase-like glycosyltransferase
LFPRHYQQGHDLLHLKQYSRLAVIPLLLLTTWLGARGLNADALWLDEVWSIHDAGGAHFDARSPLDIWNGVAVRNPWHPPGFFMILGAWGSLVGWTPFAARSLALLAGVLAVAWTYRLGRDVHSPLAGLAAAGILATGAYFSYYLHELRNYTLMLALVACVLWGYWKILSPPPRSLSRSQPPHRNGEGRASNKASEGKGWLYPLFFLAALGLLYLNYFAAFILPAIGIYHLLFAPKNGRWWIVSGLMALAGMLFLPWIGALTTGLSIVGESDIPDTVALESWEIVTRLGEVFSSGGWLLLLVTLIAALWTRKRGVWCVWFVTALTLIFMLIADTRFHLVRVGRERYLLMLWPLLAALAGIGLARIAHLRWMRGVALLLFFGWMGLGLWQISEGNFTQFIDGSSSFPWHEVQREIAQRQRPGDVLAFHVSVPNWILELTTSDFYLRDLPMRYILIETFLDNLRQVSFDRQTADFVQDAPRVWLGVDKRRKSGDSLEEFEDALGQMNYVDCGTVFEDDLARLDLYLRRLDTMPDPLLRFGDGIQLLRADFPMQTQDTLEVISQWALEPEVNAAAYSVAFHVDDAQGNFVAQADHSLPIGEFGCGLADLNVSDLPPGRYTLYAIVYTWVDGQRLPGEVVGTGETGDRLTVGEFEVRRL